MMSLLIALCLTYLPLSVLFALHFGGFQGSTDQRKGLNFLNRYLDKLHLSQLTHGVWLAWFLVLCSVIPYVVIYGAEIGITIWLAVVMFISLFIILLSPTMGDFVLFIFPVGVVIVLFIAIMWQISLRWLL